MSRKLIRKISILSIAILAVVLCVVTINATAVAANFQQVDPTPEDLEDLQMSDNALIAALALCIGDLQIGDADEDDITQDDWNYVVNILMEADPILRDCKASNAEALQSISGEGQ